MNEVVPFNFEGQNVRTVTDDQGNVWFAGKDVCDILKYTNHNDILNKVCKGVSRRYPFKTPQGLQKVKVISEPDLYRLIAKSTMPAAERFERWVFEEVLPTIRKTELAELLFKNLL